jgi:hypothetical protein
MIKKSLYILFSLDDFAISCMKHYDVKYLEPIKFLLPACSFFCGKKGTKKAARKGLHPLFGVVLLFRFSTTVASALYRYSEVQSVQVIFKRINF